MFKILLRFSYSKDAVQLRHSSRLEILNWQSKVHNGKLSGALKIRLPVDPVAVDSRLNAATSTNSHDLYHDALDGNRQVP